MTDRKPGAHALPSNYLKGCLFLLLAEAPSHGYELLDRAQELLPVRLDGGRLYRQLRAMEGDGTVASAWEGSSAGPDRRVYSVTALGMESLQRIAQAVAVADELIDTYLSRLELIPIPRTAAA